jgi:hypothetical protein
MAQTPKVKQLIPQDYPTESSWISKLISPLNSFMRSVTDALNNKLTVSENMDGGIKSVIVAGSAVKIAWDMQKPTVAFIGNIERVDGSAVSLPAAITLVWKYTQDNKIEITDVVGLDDSSSKQYRLTIMFLVK